MTSCAAVSFLKRAALLGRVFVLWDVKAQNTAHRTEACISMETDGVTRDEEIADRVSHIHSSI